VLLSADYHVVAEFVLELVNDHINRLCGRQVAGLNS